MITIDDIINSNKLPTLKQLKSQESQIELFGFSISFNEGFTSGTTVNLVMTVEEFMNFAKEHQVEEIFGIAIPYSPKDIFITNSLFDGNISDFTSVVISDYRLDLSEDEQLEYVLEKLDIDSVNQDEENFDFELPTLNLYSELKDIKDFEDEYEDDYEYNLTTTAKSLIDDITNYNNSIPENIIDIPKKLQLGCVIDGVIYTVSIENELDFNPTYFLLNILTKYQSKYDSKVKDKFDKEKQLEYEAEQAKIEQEKKQKADKDAFIKYISSDTAYLALTNDNMRFVYIESLWNGDKGEEIKNLIHAAYPEIEKQLIRWNTSISKTQKSEIRQDIKFRSGK